MAPFDLFGVSPKFFIDGKSRTLTWIGCLCSTLLVSTIITLFIFQLNWHVNKTDSLVTTFNTVVEGNELFDMQAGKQTIALYYHNNFVANVPYKTFVDFEFFVVEESLKGAIVQKKKLPSVPCEDTT